MSNTAQTISLIASLVIVFGAQTAWILRAFVQVDNRLDRVDGRLDRMDIKVDAGLARVETRLDELKTEIVRDHGERIARLEERARA